MGKRARNFGGSWTEEKLIRVSKYLRAYATIMSKQTFKFAYIDAFAGTGYRIGEKDPETSEELFPEFAEKETADFLKGSAKIALEVSPRFDKYIFIEKEKVGAHALEGLKEEHPMLAADINVVTQDANTYLTELCRKRSWATHRAVIFLDPYGMEVEWSTIELIGATKAIDLWLLFPLGVAVNRLLKRDGEINESVRQKLDRFFGTREWLSYFYRDEKSETLFGPKSEKKKVVDFEGIATYFVSRLKTVFVGVAENPLPLLNSKNNPLYLLCFAAGNEKGSPTALKIAQDILGR